jgi:hypothetical protein
VDDEAMTEKSSALIGELTEREKRYLDDLSKEYYALVDAVAGADGRLMIVKGWSVTLSLTALGLGFQQQHYALFALGALTAAAFWYLDALMKGHQLRYYSRMRDIEVAAYKVNPVTVADVGTVSAPRIDMTWGYKGTRNDWRNDPPERRQPARIRRLLRLRYLMPNVAVPHLVGVVLGGVLFCAARWDWWDGLAGIPT